MNEKKTYNIEITETLQRTISIEASSDEEAREKVEEMWKKSKIILGADDFKGVDFQLIDQ